MPEGTVLEKILWGFAGILSFAGKGTEWFQGEWLQTMRFAVKWKDFEGSLGIRKALRV